MTDPITAIEQRAITSPLTRNGIPERVVRAWLSVKMLEGRYYDLDRAEREAEEDLRAFVRRTSMVNLDG